jgi:hypothetical protein
MTALSVQPPFPILTDIDGQPLEDGFIFIGVVNLAPIANPITVYWDAALTVTATQPIRTRGGYPMNAGVPGRLYVNTDYSIQVQNRNGSVVYTSLDNNGPLGGGTISSVDVTFLQAGTSAVLRTAQAKMRDEVSVLDFGAVGNGVTDDTAAIQAALNTGKDVYFPGAQAGVVYMFTNLVIPSRTRIYGDGMRQTILRQISGTTGVAIGYSNTITSDISDGAPGFDNIAVEVAASCLTGIRISASSANMGSCRSFRLKSRHAETLGSPPYTVVAGQVGFDLTDAAGGSMYKWTLDDQCEIRSFDAAIKARATLGGINEWVVKAWILDCKTSFDLQGVSAWKTSVAHESGVQNARAFLLDLACSNLEIRDSRWELTQSGGYGMDFAATFTGSNIKVFNPAILISGDGGGIPGRKWTGTLPADFLFHGYYFDLVDSAQRAMIIAPSKNFVSLPNKVRFGGENQGDATLELGRNSGGAICYIEHDATHMLIRAGNSLQLYGDGQSGANFKVSVTSTGVGFNGTAGVAKQSLGAASTDLASVITLANNIRTALINNGLGTT